MKSDGNIQQYIQENSFEVAASIELETDAFESSQIEDPAVKYILFLETICICHIFNSVSGSFKHVWMIFGFFYLS